jgi:polyhydroxybutyrate depolymerase
MMLVSASSAGSSGNASMPPSAAPAASGAPAPTLPTSPMTTPMMTMDSGEAMPSPGCMSGSLKPGRTMGSIQSSGGNRTYIQYVPASYDGKKPLPVVVDLHPYSVGASYSESSSGFRTLADTEGYIYLAPQGMGNMWDSVGDTDEKFIRDLVTNVAKQGCVDQRRVYATGCSNGGAFSFLLMCTAEDIFAAVAPMCGTAFFDVDTMCMLDRPVSIMVRIGSQDTLNCWEGEGMVLNAPNVPAGTHVQCAKKVQMVLSAKYHCKGEIKKMAECEYVGDCDQGTEIAICDEPTGHVVYTANTARDTYAFLKRFYKP